MTDPTTDQPVDTWLPLSSRPGRRERLTDPETGSGSARTHVGPPPSGDGPTSVLDAVPADDARIADGDPGDPDDGDPGDPELFVDEQWDRPPRSNRLTRMLLVAILVVAGFGGGVLLQKKHDAGSTSSTSASGLPAGFSRGAGARGGLGTGLGGTGTGASSPGGVTGSGAATTVPVVVGTVQAVSGTTLTVQNFAGTVVTVTVPATATVTTSGLTPLSAGTTVSVSGVKQPDGSVVASAITARAAS